MKWSIICGECWLQFTFLLLICQMQIEGQANNAMCLLVYWHMYLELDEDSKIQTSIELNQSIKSRNWWKFCSKSANSCDILTNISNVCSPLQSFWSGSGSGLELRHFVFFTSFTLLTNIYPDLINLLSTLPLSADRILYKTIYTQFSYLLNIWK